MAEDNYQENEISLADIVEFIQESWKLLLAAAFIGAILGFGNWYFLGTYKAELLIQNYGGFNIISWRSTEKILPSLAAEMIEKKAVPENQRDLYRAMSASSWWTKNVVANYAITKKEAKDLAALSKDLDSAAASILSFAVYTNAASEVKAIENATQVASFLSNGSAYLAIKNLMNDYEGKSITQVASVQQKISATEIELAYLKERAKNLEALQKRFPGSVNVAQQVVDPKDAGAKYLPLTTQIIAVNSDINANKEDLERLNDQLNQVKTYKVFLDAAQNLVSNRYDGLALTREFLQVEEQLRAKVPKGDVKALQNLDQIRSQFIRIELSFKNRLHVIKAPTATKAGMLKSTAAGIVIAAFLMLAYLLGRKLLSKLKLTPTSHM
jgi:hypothetical protein